MFERFLPHGPLEKVQRGSLPYSSDFLKHIADALALPPASYQELIRPLQEDSKRIARGQHCRLLYEAHEIR